MKKKKQKIDPDQATACLVILLEQLKVIKLVAHKRSFLESMDPIPANTIRGMSTSSGSLYYTAEKYNR